MKQGQEHEYGCSDTIAFTDQVCQPSAGDDGQTNAHFLGNPQKDGDNEQEEQDWITEFCTGDGIGGHAAGIVVRHGSDGRRTKYG